MLASRTWQTLRAATWLEWQTRGNWTNPVMYLLYLVVRPMTASLVLVVMYRVVAGPAAHGAILGYLIVGSAAWSFVDQIISGMPQAVLADREEYAMLKYIYITPSRFLVFLFGRSLPRVLVALISFVITLSLGIAFLGVPIDLLTINVPLLLLALVLGGAGIIALGFVLTGTVLVLKRGAWQMPQAVTGALYLVTGAIFPVTVLPLWLRDVALALPLTYWLELVRRALLGANDGATFPVTATTDIILMNLATTAVLAIVALVVFRICEHVARERGQIDRTTGY
jgi:ABC-2 type transport system permease protein